MDAAPLVAVVARPVVAVVAMQAVDKAKATAAMSATTTVAATLITKALAALHMHRVAQRQTVAHVHPTRSKMALTKVHRKSVTPKPPRKAAAMVVRTATLPTRASASTCNATACTCSPAL